MPRTLPPLLALACSLLPTAPAAAAELKLLLPLGRTAYQTNEWLAVSVVRSGAQDLPAATLALSLSAADGGRVAVTFPLPPAPAAGGRAVQTGHYHLNGWLLRPGRYQ